jgi:hypothetical protein
MRTKEVSFDVNRKQEAALTKYSGKVKKYFMEKEVFNRLKQILKERNDKDFEEAKMKEQFDAKKENQVLKRELREIKSIMIEKFDVKK